jgi:hypothetical protein
MGITGKNREGISKYRRFEENPEGAKSTSAHFGVRNAVGA